MQMLPEQLLHKLQKKEELPRLVGLFDEDGFYSSKLPPLLTAYLTVDEQEPAVTVFERDTDLTQLREAINAYPFFSGSNLVIIKDEKLWTPTAKKADEEPETAKAGKGKKAAPKSRAELLLAELSELPDYCRVVLVGTKLDKRGKLYKLLLQDGIYAEGVKLRPAQIGPWLNEQAALYGARLEGGAVQLIIEFLYGAENAPLLLLEQEMAKLALYAGERKLWTREDVEQVFSALPSVARFTLNNAIAEKKTAKVLELLEGERKQGTAVIALCGMVAFGLRRMARIKECEAQGLAPAQIAQELKISPYFLKAELAHGKGFTSEALQTALLELAAMNIDIRRGGRQYRRLEEILLTLLR